MFEQTFVGGGQTRKPWTVLTAFALQVFLILVAIIIPMWRYDVPSLTTMRVELRRPCASGERSTSTMRPRSIVVTSARCLPRRSSTVRADLPSVPRGRPKTASRKSQRTRRFNDGFGKELDALQ